MASEISRVTAELETNVQQPSETACLPPSLIIAIKKNKLVATSSHS
ncbi:unnamed protein product [Oikopleura dioica]|uniref:Uncharacterized protein n=1 Tax=Oikopleura dioica TaxID=34765 RepID=E4Y329_OIKDI|nr:unnamed protein product [Oikopleura dioica]